MNNQDNARIETEFWTQECRALEIRYPGIFQVIEAVMAARRKRTICPKLSLEMTLVYWNQNKRLFQPDTGTDDYAIMRCGGLSFRVCEQKLVKLRDDIRWAANHRYIQQVFSFDAAMADQLAAMSEETSPADTEKLLHMKLPLEVLFRMPYPAFAIVPNLGPDTTIVKSFLVHQMTETNPEDGSQSLKLTIRARVTLVDGPPAVLSWTICVRPGMSLADAIDHAMEHLYECREEDKAKSIALSTQLVQFCLPFITYLCAQNRDVSGQLVDVAEVKPARARLSIVRPATPSIADVGVRVGAALRLHQASAVRPTYIGGAGNGRVMPPHVRRAHWHVYWKGARNRPEHRFPVLHFLTATPVNLDFAEEPTAVVRPVMA